MLRKLKNNIIRLNIDIWAFSYLYLFPYIFTFFDNFNQFLISVVVISFDCFTLRHDTATIFACVVSGLPIK